MYFHHHNATASATALQKCREQIDACSRHQQHALVATDRDDKTQWSTIPASQNSKAIDSTRLPSGLLYCLVGVFMVSWIQLTQAPGKLRRHQGFTLLHARKGTCKKKAHDEKRQVARRQGRLPDLRAEDGNTRPFSVVATGPFLCQHSAGD